MLLGSLLHEIFQLVVTSKEKILGEKKIKAIAQEVVRTSTSLSDL